MCKQLSCIAIKHAFSLFRFVDAWNGEDENVVGWDSAKHSTDDLACCCHFCGILIISEETEWRAWFINSSLGHALQQHLYLSSTALCFSGNRWIEQVPYDPAWQWSEQPKNQSGGEKNQGSVSDYCPHGLLWIELVCQVSNSVFTSLTEASLLSTFIFARALIAVLRSTPWFF